MIVTSRSYSNVDDGVVLLMMFDLILLFLKMMVLMTLLLIYIHVYSQSFSQHQMDQPNTTTSRQMFVIEVAVELHLLRLVIIQFVINDHSKTVI